LNEYLYSRNTNVHNTREKQAKIRRKYKYEDDDKNDCTINEFKPCVTKNESFYEKKIRLASLHASFVVQNRQEFSNQKIVNSPT